MKPGEWTRSKKCHTANCCVEVSQQKDEVWVRSSENPGQVLRYTYDEWRDFLAGARNGDFDVEGE